MALVQTSDFVGEFKCPADQFNTQLLQLAIDENENTVIRRIFGAELGNEIIAYIANPLPLNPDFEQVINSFEVDQNAGCSCHGGLLESKGLKYALTSFIYREFQNSAKLMPTQVGGLTRPKVELSDSDMLPQAQLIMKYNNGVKTIWAIQCYVRENRETYPNANPQKFLLDYIL